MFSNSKFNGDISQWNVFKVVDMFGMFDNSEFSGDISNWNVTNIQSVSGIFNSPLTYGYKSKCPLPYWAKIENLDERKKAVAAYHLKNELDIELSKNNTQNKNMKI